MHKPYYLFAQPETILFASTLILVNHGMLMMSWKCGKMNVKKRNTKQKQEHPPAS